MPKLWPLLLALAPSLVSADVYEAEPTDGISLPTAPLAGDFDGRVVSTNPGGSPLLRGAELAIALDYQRDLASSTGHNVGLYVAGPFGGGVLPKLGLGAGVDWLHSANTLVPDPGNRVRFTLTAGTALGRYLGWGIAWHRFRDDGRLDGVDTYDFGLALRAGNRVALGAVVRDLATPRIDDVRIDRRYELETVMRPFSTDVLEGAIGGRLGNGHRDGWARMAIKIASGLFVHAAIETRNTTRIDGAVETDGRELRITGGLEVSFGVAGATALATGIRDDKGSTDFLGGQAVLRISSIGPASLIGRRTHIERFELTGQLDTATMRRLRAISRDPSVAAVVVVLNRLATGPGTRREVRRELETIQRAGKRVFAHLLSATQAEYHIASAADRIYLDPAVDLYLVGMTATKVYARGALDKLGAAPQFLKIEEYKDAPEMFTESGPSASSKKQTEALVDSLWDRFLTDVASARRIDKADLSKLVDQGPYTASALAGSKLIDGVATTEELDDVVERDLGRTLPVAKATSERPTRWNRPRIAVVHIDGQIVRGKSPPRSIFGGSGVGDETIVAAIKRAREDRSIDAIVIRVNSPGGDSVASELISREVFATRGKKPVICSFGDYAASGGYFVAAGCDEILAEPTTITGSIGVFAGKLDVAEPAKALGIRPVTTQRGVRAGIYDAFMLPFVPLPLAFRPWSEDESAALMITVRHAYDRFVGAVAKGRGLVRAKVDEIGRGRVWTGAQALEVKLVDRLGNINDAIDEAARRAGVPTDDGVELVEMPTVPGLLDWLRGAGQLTMPRIEQGSVIQARMLFDLIW